MRPRDPFWRLERRLQELARALDQLRRGRLVVRKPSKVESELIAALRDVEFLADVFRERHD
jgi:hypothetical protein